MGQTRALFVLFSFYSHDKYSTNKSIDGVLGTQTRGGRMVGADDSTELWQHPFLAHAKVYNKGELHHVYAYRLIELEVL